MSLSGNPNCRSTEGTPGENRQEAKDRILEAYCNDGKILNLSGLGLKSIPHEIDVLSSLEHLHLGDNQLITLPESIGSLSELTVLELQENQLTTLPESIGNLSNLLRLNVLGNQLTTLPESIGSLSELGGIHLQDNRLTTLPESIGNLQYLLLAQLEGNPFRSFPQNLLNLPNRCIITVSVGELSHQVMGRLQTITHAPDYSGPEVLFLNQEVLEECSSSLDELLVHYSEIAGVPHQEPKCISRLDEEQKVELQSWLSRLSAAGDLRRAGESEKAFAQKVLSYLNRADQDEGFRDVFLGVIKDASTTCGDRVALSLIQVGLAYQLATTDLNDPKKLAHLLLRGPGAMGMLEVIARDKVPTLQMVDEIEVYLAYPIKLREALGLPIEVDSMLYFNCSGVTEKDLEEAKEKVQSFFDDQEASLRFLIKQDKWIDLLKKHSSEQYEAINEKRYDMALEEQYEAAEAYYQEALIKLSKEVLSVS